MFKTVIKISLALICSFLLTIVCVAFVPSIFHSSLDTTLELLPKHKFLERKSLTKAELYKDLKLSQLTQDDEENFHRLRQAQPNNRDKSTFFAHMFVIHDSPQKCQFRVIGMHRTLDAAWEVTGLRCDGRKSCKLALEEQVCKEHKEPNHERHH